ncbi:hypothetical protein AVEN_83238-1 [Araneus ventricosus]|uniref:Uncharacterized protein n=1 Tax=Araneus ventricosus TaxID=182803 RepID=A0A4Y2SUY6_ARAVE|nr:hypothetical protein AVEN_83238-1 [Araneus ventricosus]
MRPHWIQLKVHIPFLSRSSKIRQHDSRHNDSRSQFFRSPTIHQVSADEFSLLRQLDIQCLCLELQHINETVSRTIRVGRDPQVFESDGSQKFLHRYRVAGTGQTFRRQIVPQKF